ncbi:MULTISPECIES: hypothetical protein [unclassified Lysobacter]|uniref:hypothetical protein n=1 Tax=unclassified Lysobacter TaxID=2635362 RepID=UPI0006F5A96F|nr:MULTISPECIES: hypothetical protein [unclassified Lysobacter]KRA17044.1 hypothetical protein ASD69_09940 [Lysobacter sp. Root604]KRD31491.1 hypothetical protein ASE35_15970 [Lysobacter sp. Root916]
MYWLFLLLALAALVIAFKASSGLLLVVSLLASLGFFIAWILGLLAARIGSSSRDEGLMLDPNELRRLREQAEARKLAAAQPPQTSSSEPQQQR